MRCPARITAAPVESAFSVFVDASCTGWGGVIVCRSSGEVTVCGERWEPGWDSQHINVLEGEALRRVLLRLPAAAAGSRVRVVVDNTTVRHVALRGVCLQNGQLNRSVMSALSHLHRMGCAVSLQWLRSAYNPADLPSRVRMTAITGASLQKLQRQVEGFLRGRPVCE